MVMPIRTTMLCKIDNDVNKDLDDARGMKVKAVKHDDNKDVVAENSCVKEELDKYVQGIEGMDVSNDW